MLVGFQKVVAEMIESLMRRGSLNYSDILMEYTVSLKSHKFSGDSIFESHSLVIKYHHSWLEA